MFVHYNDFLSWDFHLENNFSLVIIGGSHYFCGSVRKHNLYIDPNDAEQSFEVIVIKEASFDSVITWISN